MPAEFLSPFRRFAWDTLLRMKTPLTQSGKTVRILRVCKDLKQRDLADLAGVSRETIVQLERGDRTPHRATANAIAQALGVDPSVIWPNRFGTHPWWESPTGY
jgi:transcriptional regulator with XRE-family HTH domain